MKKTLFIFACTLAITVAHAKVKTFPDSPRIVPLSELSYEKIRELLHCQNSPFTVELKHGAVVPLQFLTRNRVFSAMLDPNLTFKIEKTCYLRVVNKQCYLSDDLVHWQKPGRFLDGEAAYELKPGINKGFLLETTLVPSEDDQED